MRNWGKDQYVIFRSNRGDSDNIVVPHHFLSYPSTIISPSHLTKAYCVYLKVASMEEIYGSLQGVPLSINPTGK
jgi:hypothetical protein